MYFVVVDCYCCSFQERAREKDGEREKGWEEGREVDDSGGLDSGYSH